MIQGRLLGSLLGKFGAATPLRNPKFCMDDTWNLTLLKRRVTPGMWASI